MTIWLELQVRWGFLFLPSEMRLDKKKNDLYDHSAGRLSRHGKSRRTSRPLHTILCGTTSRLIVRELTIELARDPNEQRRRQ